ncbi:TolC family protein [Puteibacter caeruleilacunae]|nr:TolC family protein [Puteibacter caeruleilacunae]
MKRNNYIRAFVVLSLFIGLQSCFVAKSYRQPELQIEDQYRGVVTSDSVTLASMPWQELFTDPYLNELIEVALSENLDLLMAIERVKVAQAYYKQGKMERLPGLNLGASAGTYELSDNSLSGVAAQGNGPSYENYQLNASISWEADIWGKLRSSKRAAQAAYLQSDASRRAVQSALVANVASAYYQLLALDAQVKVASETVVNRKEGLETMKSLKNAGRVTEAAVKQTEAQLYSTEILLVNLKQNVHLLENTISLMIGKQSGTITRGTLSDQNATVDIEVGFPLQLLSNRPDVMAAEYGLQRSFELTNVARSNFYPSLSLSANGGLESIDFDDWFNSNALFSNAIANLTQPLLNKRRVRTQYEVAKAQQAEAKYNFRKTVLNAGNEVVNALEAYKSEEQRYQLQLQEIKALKEAVRYSEELLNNAYQNTTYLEVLSARSNALASEINTINSKYRQLNSLVELYKALGGGWK